MEIRILKTPEDFSRYDAWVRGHPQGNLWQSLEWKQYQEALGREVRVYIGGEEGTILASALVVIDRTTGGFSTWDIPRGPLIGVRCQVLGVNVADSLLQTIVQDAKQDRCLALSLSPPSPLDAAESFRLEASTRHEQPEATRIIDLTETEEEILAQMHPKGRYNIKVAQKNGIHVEESQDIDAFYSLLQQTAGRDEFRILPLRTYRAFLECQPGSFLLMAYVPPPLTPPPCGGEGTPPSPGRRGRGLGGGGRKPIAGLLGVVWSQTGLYYYGASNYAHRSLMAPYALQWEAMRLCKARGCARYDLLGIAPHHDTSHPWAGVSVFKEKFGGTIVTYPPEQQIVLRPVLWKALQWKRWIAG